MNFSIMMVLVSLMHKHKRAVRARHWNTARFTRAEFHAVRQRAKVAESVRSLFPQPDYDTDGSDTQGYG